MARILQEDIEALKQRADFADVVSDHTRLQRSGARLKGLCPFHQERTPSFHVDPAQGYFHCFGCGEGGDVYSFLQRIEGLSFVEAVEQLARRVGYPLRYEELSAGQKRALGQRTRLVAANQAACDFYRKQLLVEEGAPARAYLSQRGFGRAEAEHFLLGFAPMAWDALSRHLKGQRFEDREIEEAGLAVRNSRGGLRDRFRGRLMFPVLDSTGDVIGFGGRVLPGLEYGDQEPPKYLNTAETALYHKHRVLYGLSWARAEVVRTSEALVVEGYTDVIALHRAGLTNVVATCGTAVDEEHFRLLARYAGRVVLAFDADAAGQMAAERAWRLSREHALEVAVLVLPPGRDPADIVAEEGAEAVRDRARDAEPVLRFMLRRAAGSHPDTPEGRAAAVDATAALLAQVEDPALRDQYGRWVADDLVGVSLAVVAEAVQRAGARLAAVPTRVTAPEAAGGEGRKERPARARLEREALRLALQHPDLLPSRWSEVEEDDFTHPRARQIFRALTAAGGPGAGLGDVLAAAPDDELRGLIRAVAFEESTVEPDEAHVRMHMGRLLVHRLEREISTRKRQLERMNPTVDPDVYRERFEALIALEARRRDLREMASG